MTGFNWVAQATDPQSANRKYVYVRDSIAMAADGCRLHKAHVTLDDGVWSCEGAKVEHVVKAPTFDKVFFDLASAESVVLTAKMITTILVGEHRVEAWRIADRTVIRAMCLRDALGDNALGATVWHIREDGRSKVAGFSAHGEFVIGGLHV